MAERVRSENANGERLRVMVVDDHALFRRGLEMVLSQEPDIELVGEASDGAEAVERATELMPDVVLMDVRMPRRSGIEAAGQIKDMLPHVKILMLTISDEEADLYDAIKAGASGYLLKDRTSVRELSKAIKIVRSGGAVMSPNIARTVMRYFAEPTAPDSGLSRREREVLSLLSQGLMYKEIGNKLAISLDTVRKHLGSIYRKLHVHSRTDAVRHYLQRPR